MMVEQRPAHRGERDHARCLGDHRTVVAAQESRLKPRLGPSAKAEGPRPFTGRGRAASSLALFGHAPAWVDNVTLTDISPLRRGSAPAIILPEKITRRRRETTF